MGSYISVTLHVQNTIEDPTFDFSLTAKQWRWWWQRRSNLLTLMQLTANEDVRFRFTVTYFNRDLGYFVNAINKLEANYERDRTFWLLTDSAGRALKKGVSNYYPQRGETICFVFTKADPDQGCPGTSS